MPATWILEGGDTLTTETLKSVSTKEKLIVALDVSTATEARRAFDALREEACMFKVGSQLFTAAGPEFVRELVAAGARVFLDLKFHDIPNTVAAASREAARLGVSIFNVHAAGGGEMLRAAADATSDEAARRSEEHTSELQSLAYLVCRLLLEKKKECSNTMTCN